MNRGRRFLGDPEFYFNLLLLAFTITVLALSLQLSTRARFIPLIVSIGVLPLTILNLLACLSPPLRERISALKAGEFISVKGADSAQKDDDPPPFSDFIKLVFWFTGAYGVFFFAGYLPMVVCFSLFFLKLRIGFTWAKSAIMTGLFGVVTSGIFTGVLGLEPFGMRYYF